MSMITATVWVPRGIASPFPTKYNFDEEEFQRIAELAKIQLDDANDDLDEAEDGKVKRTGQESMNEEEISHKKPLAKAAKSTG